jgi:APA family basic amino acid/polyamine antiporter
MDTTGPRGRLLKVLGLGFGLAVTVGNTVGSGILRTPGDVAAHLPGAWAYLAVWVAGGLYALLGASVISELGAMMPRSGGFYVFARRALGDFPAFVVGWTDWVSQSGTTAASAIVIAEYAGELTPALAAHQVAVALLVVGVVTLVQVRGIRWGSRAQGLTSALKGLLFLLVVAALLAARPEGGFHQPAPLPGGAALLLALQAVIYTYDGWYGIIYFGEEVRDPGRDVPRSMIGGVLMVMALYLLVNAALVRLLPMGQLAGQTLALGAGAERVLGPRGGQMIRVLGIISVLGGINAYVLMGSRIAVALTRDRLLPPAFAGVNAGGTPGLGLLTTAAGAALFIVTGSFRQVMAVMTFFFVANYVLAYLAVFVLRRREPAAPRPVRAWGHPFSTALALALAVAFLVGVVAADSAASLRSLLVLAASYPVYRLTRRRHGTPPGTDPRRV